MYTVGEIGNHRVAVVGYYQEQGLAASGSMAAEVIRDLPNLQFGLLVGISGGIPSSTNDMQLGDVAVATPEDNRPGIVGYDLGKEVEDGRYELKHWQNSTHPLLRSVINLIRARNGSQFRRHLRILDKHPEFQRPEAALHTDPMRPKVHYGTILSGNTVIKSQSRRDQLRDMYGGIAVEMEAAGIMTRLPVAVIRGISDFADSSKNSAWQPYAAIAAAAYAKEVLLCLPYEDRKVGKPLPGTLISYSKITLVSRRASRKY
jgi:nucleoside phosphorylase